MPISNMEERQLAQAVADIRSATRNASYEEVRQLRTTGKIPVQIYDLICEHRRGDWPPGTAPALDPQVPVARPEAAEPKPRRSRPAKEKDHD